MAAQSCRGLPAELAAKLVVKVISSIGSFFYVWDDTVVFVLMLDVNHECFTKSWSFNIVIAPLLMKI